MDTDCCKFMERRGEEMNTYTWVRYHDDFLFLFLFLLFFFFFWLLGCTWDVCTCDCFEYMCWRFIPPRLTVLEIPFFFFLFFFSRAYLHSPVAYKVFLSPVGLSNPRHTPLASILADQAVSRVEQTLRRNRVSLPDVFKALFDAYVRWVADVNELLP